MKIALVHDYIKEYGGAERVLEALHEIWPDAPVFTSVYFPQFLGPHRKRFDTWDIRTSWMQKIPYAYKLISPMRLYSDQIFENFDFSGFDAVIVSATGAYFPNLILTDPETKHICYCHTPPRYLYGYATARNWKNNIIGRAIGEYFNVGLRQRDFVSYQRPDYIIANSSEVKARIAKFYRREAEVIYPPVDMKMEVGSRKSEVRNRYYLAGGRLARAKNIHLAIEACNRMKATLKIFGKSFAGYGEELKKIAGPTVEFLGEVSEEKLSILYSNAKALIYPSTDEDFGIMPVEAQGYGVPVIAYRGGGVMETVIDGKTGVFFDEPSAGGIIKAIKQLSNKVIKNTDCLNNARRFSKSRFQREIVDFINTIL